MSAKQIAESALQAERNGLHDVAKTFLATLAFQVFHRYDVSILIRGYHSFVYLIGHDEHPLCLN